LRRTGEFWSNFEYTPDRLISKQSAIRSIVIKGVAADLKIVQILSEMTDIWIGTDGASHENRSFVELHIMGIYKEEYQYHLVNIIEKHHSSGETIANWIASQFDYFNKLQRMLNILETFIYDIKGIVMDTTSENTGKYNGIAAILEKLRQEMFQSKFQKDCDPIIVKSCSDHVAQLCISEFRKRIVDILISMNLNDLLTSESSEKQFILFPMMNCFGNFIGKGDQKIALKSKILEYYKVKDCSINPINEVRYLSFCNLTENFVEYFDVIFEFIQKHQDAGLLTEVQQKYFKYLKNPLIRLSLKMFEMLSNKILKKIMKTGNITHSCNEYQEMLKDILKNIQQLKMYDFNQELDSTSFNNDLEKRYTQLNAKIIFNSLLDSTIFMLFKWDSNYIVPDKGIKNNFIVASNRQAERFISSIKQQLNKNRNMRLIVIISFCKLKNLNFKFSDFSLEMRVHMKQMGRNIYNNSITRKEFDGQKAIYYFQQLDESIVKKKGMDEIDEIKTFLIHEEFINSSESLTLAVMKRVLKVLHEEGYYSGKLSIGNKEEHVKLFRNEIMNIDFTEFKNLNKL